jgi:uncharacterized membrane protein
MRAMVNTQTVLLTIHILFVVLWVGGASMLILLEARVRAAADATRRAALVQDAAWIGPRLFAPAGVILVATGIGMVQHDFGGNYDLWVVLALIGWGATFVTGNFVLAPTSKKLVQRIEQTGPADAETVRLIDRFILTARVDVAVLFLVILDMVLKPGS